MRGSPQAVAATLLTCLTVAVACQPARANLLGGQTQPSSIVVWWSADRSLVVPFAAAELARYLTRMSGAVVAVQPGAFTAGLSKRVAASLVLLTARDAAGRAAQGSSVRLDASWTAGPAGGLDSTTGDAFATAVEDGDRAVMVAADQRGILYAAYDLLERLGVRFFAPDFTAYRGTAETVPRRAVALPAYQTYQHGGLTARVIDLDESWTVSAGALDALIDWMGKARMNVLAIASDLDLSGINPYDNWRTLVASLAARRGIVIEVGQHGYENWLPRARYPQFYVRTYSVFDIASEPAVATYVGAVTAYLSARPEIGVFDAWPPDNATWPADVIDRFGSASNAQAYLVGRLTSALAARLPAVRVETIAYQATQEPPTAPYAYDPERNLIDVAMASRTYSAAISSAANAPSAALMARWRHAFSGDLSAYEYYRRYSFRSLPFPLADVIGGDLAWYHQIGVNGIRSYGEPGDWVSYELTHLAIAAAAWDPGQDPAALLAGYLRDRFGAAAGGVGQYLAAAEAAGASEFGGGTVPQAKLDAAMTGYGTADADLVSAAASAKPGSPGAFVIQRLRWNADFALADARLMASVAAGDAVTALEARAAGAALLEAHRFDGILADNPRYTPQYGTASRSSQDYPREYRSGLAFVDDGGIVTLAPGAVVQIKVTAQAADLAAHRVTWTLTSSGGVALVPSAGSLSVTSASSGSSTVTITAGHDRGRYHVGLVATSGGQTWSAAGIDVVVAGAGDLAPYRDSVAVSSDVGFAIPTFDGNGCGYSQQALVAAGLVSGGQVVVDGLTLPWPATNGSFDNVVARGQQVALPPDTRGSRLVLLASAAPGAAVGAGWVRYADATRTYYQVVVPDWLLSAGPSTLSAETRVVVQGAYHTCSRPTAGAEYVYALEVPLDPNRAVSAVALPFAFGGSLVHVFALAVG
jgi:hypothetical protein